MITKVVELVEVLWRLLLTDQDNVNFLLQSSIFTCKCIRFYSRLKDLLLDFENFVTNSLLCSHKNNTLFLIWSCLVVEIRKEELEIQPTNGIIPSSLT